MEHNRTFYIFQAITKLSYSSLFDLTCRCSALVKKLILLKGKSGFYSDRLPTDSVVCRHNGRGKEYIPPICTGAGSDASQSQRGVLQLEPTVRQRLLF